MCSTYSHGRTRDGLSQATSASEMPLLFLRMIFLEHNPRVAPCCLSQPGPTPATSLSQTILTTHGA